MYKNSIKSNRKCRHCYYQFLSLSYLSILSKSTTPPVGRRHIYNYSVFPADGATNVNVKCQNNKPLCCVIVG